MRTNIVLDEALVAKARKLTGIATKRALVHEALKTLVAVRERKSLLDLRGKLRFAPGFDPVKLRRARGIE